MDFNLTVEQQQIRDEIKKICKEFPDAYWREIDSKKEYPESFVRKLSDLGWLAALIPEEFGGNGLGITDTGTWSDRVWLSSNPDGTGNVVFLAQASHLGQLGVNPVGYSRSVEVMLPEGLDNQTRYINVSTGGPYEFIHTDNNRSAIAIQVTLAPSPDLVVKSVVLNPESPQAGPVVAYHPPA